MTELCDIAFKYGTDKCPQIKHHFTEFYDYLFSDRRDTVKKVAEIGIGKLAVSNVIGASLFMWKEYFKNAHIFGADIDRSFLFQDERINTYYCDQRSFRMLKKFVQIVGSDVDLFVDDGLHDPESQIFTCSVVMPLLSKKSVYVIEDCAHRGAVMGALRGYKLQSLRRSKLKYADDCMIVVRK